MPSPYEKIEERYNFRLPTVYQTMQSRRWFEFNQNNPHYLWLNEAEWLSLKKIAEYDFGFPSLHNFVPFAITGAGDTWCWLPSPDENHPSPIVLCPHDWHMATVYAPHFEGFLYRQIIDFATDGIEVEDDEEGRQWIHNWQFVFHDFLPSEWIDTLQDIATRPLIKPEPDSHYTGLITEAENHEIVQRDLAFARLNEEFVWWQES